VFGEFFDARRETQQIRFSNCVETTTSVSSGAPRVSVPVLSKTTVVTLCARCSASALLIRMPFFAPKPVPTITAVGVARRARRGRR